MMSGIPFVALGTSGVRVSKLGFGTFDFGVPSSHITPEQGGRLLLEAHKLGVRYWDTSEDYESHPHVAWALRRLPRDEVTLSTKTNARSPGEASESLRRSLRELGTDTIDIFFLHYVRSEWIELAGEVLKQMAGLRKSGQVRALGLSTHSVKVVQAAASFEALDVIMAVCCQASERMVRKYPEHIPLEDGSMDEMLEALELAHERGKGICAIKILGNGVPPLARRYRQAIRSIAALGFVDTLVVGMKSREELEKNIAAVTA